MFSKNDNLMKTEYTNEYYLYLLNAILGARKENDLAKTGGG
ncbi:MAG: hypothetical protein ACP5GU_06640 [Thermoprotei archaeon]|jgi:hypothetical protein